MNSFQIARFCATVKPLALLLLMTACGGAGGADGTDDQDKLHEPPVAVAGSGSGGDAGELPVIAEDSEGGQAMGGAAADSGSSGAVATSAGMGGAPEATGGQPGGTAGTATGGAPTAGAGGMSQGGTAQGGKPAADPLEPTESSCPGYIKVPVPIDTCVWAHGAKFTVSGEGHCSVAISKTCATFTATSEGQSFTVSAGTPFERFDVVIGGCPKQCSN